MSLHIRLYAIKRGGIQRHVDEFTVGIAGWKLDYSMREEHKLVAMMARNVGHLGYFGGVARLH